MYCHSLVHYDEMKDIENIRLQQPAEFLPRELLDLDLEQAYRPL